MISLVTDKQNAKSQLDLLKNLSGVTFLTAAILITNLILGYIALTFLLRSNVSLRAELSDLIYPVVNGLTACVWFYAAFHSAAKSRVRTAWTFLAMAQLSFALGDAIWAVLELYLFQSPSPSIADVFYLMYYPLFVTGLLFFPARSLNYSQRLKLSIDTGIIIISVSLISWIFVIAPIIVTNKADILVLELSLAYPVMDLLLLFVLLTLLFRQVNSINRTTLMLLFSGGIVEIIYDFVYSIMTLQGTYVSGSPVDILGMSGYALFILAGVSYLNAEKLDLPKTLVSSEPQSNQFGGLYYIPYLSAGAAYLLLVWSRNSGQLQPFTYHLEIGVGIIIGLVFIRQIVTHKENTELYDRAMQEISERKYAEDSLKKSEHRLENIIDFLPDATLVIDNKKAVIAWNRAMEEMTGVSKDNVIGQGAHGYTVPFYGEQRKYLLDLLDADDKDLSSKYQYVKKNGNILYTEAYTPALNGGKGAYVWATGAPIFDNQGNRIGAIESIRDITERKHMVDALQESKRRLADIIDFLPDSTFVVDKDGKVIAWNHAVELLTGIKAKDILGRDNYEHSLPFYGHRRPVLVDLVLKPDEETEKEYFNLRREQNHLVGESYMPMLGGGKTYLWCVASALYDSKGDLVGAIESIRDITERKHSEDALKASLHEKEVLIKEVHHRVKNNLQIVSSLLRIQSMSIQDENALEAFQDSQDRIRSMALVHEKLYRSSDLSNVHINEYISQLTSELIRGFGSEKKAKVYLDLEDAFLGIDKAIPFGLILNELITNCLKHAFPGDKKGEIHVGLNSDGNRLELTVYDNGVGMPQDMDIHRIRSTGLTLVQSLVKQLKGTINIKDDGGTRFEICIDT